MDASKGSTHRSTHHPLHDIVDLPWQLCQNRFKDPLSMALAHMARIAHLVALKADHQPLHIWGAGYLCSANQYLGDPWLMEA